MWPWTKRVAPVLVDEAGDDATATLTMILRHHRRSVTVEEVRDAVQPRDDGRANAAAIVAAAGHFGLHGQGLKITGQPTQALPAPSIAHLSRDPVSPEDPPTGPLANTYFAVLERASRDTVNLIDPFSGRLYRSWSGFWRFSTGIFLVFEEGPGLPRARQLTRR